jgi:hypothetical protein
MACDVPHRDFLSNVMLLLTRLVFPDERRRQEKESTEILQPDIAFF